MKLNIGCGRDYREGWFNIDISPDVRADMRLDIRTQPLIKGGTVGYDGEDPVMRPILIEDGSASEIYISGVLEQIGDNDQFIFAMNECWRVLKIGGVMTVVVPNAKYAIAHQDPMDVRKFTPATFEYFIAGNRHHELYGSVYGFMPWSHIEGKENARGILTMSMTK